MNIKKRSEDFFSILPKCANKNVPIGPRLKTGGSIKAGLSVCQSVSNGLSQEPLRGFFRNLV